MVEARHPDKAPDAFRTISEVADELELPQHVLRFWETKFTHIRPVKRAGGRRYYRREDVDLLRGIRRLLYSEGYTIKGVQKILKEQGVRHVQAVGFDDGPAEFGAPPAPRRNEPDTAPMHTDEGAGFGGLLGGFLPRRKSRAAADEMRDVPGHDEPPLPFPDFANFTPRTEEPVPPPRQRAQPRAPEPRPKVERSEPAFEVPREPPARVPEQPRAAARPRQPMMEEEPESYEPRVDPVFDAPPPRPEPRPMPRPSRGPASRIPDRSHAPEMDDPLLPFFDDRDAEDPVSEPLDARIRRLREGTPPAVPFDSGPPSEFVPKRARRPVEPQPEPEDEDILDDYHAVPPPRAARPPEARPHPADMHDQLPFGAPARAARRAEPPQEPPMSFDRQPPRSEPVLRRPLDEPPARPDPRYRPEPPLTARRPASLDDEDMDEGNWEPDDGQGDFEERGWQRHAPQPERFEPPPRMPNPSMATQPARRQEPVRHDPYEPRPGDRAPRDMRGSDWQQAEDDGAYGRSVQRERPRAQPAPLRAHRAEPQDPFFDPPDMPAPPLGGARRVGPLLGPLEEYEPEDFVPDGPSPARPVTERRGAASEHVRPHRPETWADEDDGYAPPEPNRPGPPEQYLPPHLRSEPRMAGTPQPPAPVLTREDISRLQSALFELTECRRIIASLGVPRGVVDSET